MTPTTTSILTSIPDWIQLAALLLMAICLTATVVARITPTKVDDEYVSKFTGWILKAVAVLPTLGVNPKTKAMEAALKELQEQKATDEAQPEPVQK